MPIALLQHLAALCLAYIKLEYFLPLLECLSRPFATSCSPLQHFPLPPPAHVRPTSCKTYLALMQHLAVCCNAFHSPPAHLLPMSCNTSQSALPPHAPLCLATSHSPHFPPARVRLSCNTYLALLQHYCKGPHFLRLLRVPYVLQRLFLLLQHYCNGPHFLRN